MDRGSAEGGEVEGNRGKECSMMTEDQFGGEMITKEVTVTFGVQVTLDETKFTEEFLAEFRKDFYNFNSIDDHAMHLAQLAARGVYNLSTFDKTEFVEGYGPIGEMGISVEILDQEQEMVS